MSTQDPLFISSVDSVDAASSLHLSKPEPKGLSKTNTISGESTLEASQLVATLFAPLVSVPVLSPPSKDNLAVESLSSILASMSERKKMEFLFSLVDQMGEITTNINDIFIRSLHAMIEETRRIINSTAYKNAKELAKEGHASTVKIKQLTSSENSDAAKDKIQTTHVELLETLEQLNQLSEDAKNSQILSVPFTVLFTVTGTLALNKEYKSSEAAGDVILLTQKLQPLIPHIRMEDILPLINLMIMAPIIFRPLDEEIQNQKTGHHVDYTKLVLSFAKDVLKMVTDPTFALINGVNHIERMDQLQPKEKQSFIAVLKLILSSVALSLLYSLEVGKIHKGIFLGMESVEFKALLDPDQPLINPINSKNMSVNERLMNSLINQIRLQITDLPVEHREEVIQTILDFLKYHYRIDKLLDPAKVLSKVFQSMNVPFSAGGFQSA